MGLFNTLMEYVEKGLIQYQTHPTLDLYIFNYTRTTQFEKNWDKYTLICRGLVMNSKGEVIARPFEKFFNWEELINNNVEIPNCDFDVYEKMDGSLGIVFYYNNEWHLCTRGSFTSDQSIKGKEMFDKSGIEKYLNPELTYMFEIIY